MPPMTDNNISVDVIIPAAGIGKRMKSIIPKQYLKIDNMTILEITINKFLISPYVNQVIVAVRSDDDIFDTLCCSHNERVLRVEGGEERVNSVLNGLKVANTEWVMVHDAARPCITQEDIANLICAGSKFDGGIIGCPVRDTMKRTNELKKIITTVDRNLMFHALTPQFFRREQLINAINKGLNSNVTITDESSAMEFVGIKPLLVEGRSDNIKITQPSDLALAEFILKKLD